MCVGLLSSLDDFYLLGSGLLMTQTSLPVFNSSLLSPLSPHSLLAWHRVRVANALARSGQQWARIFSKFNSGTQEVGLQTRKLYDLESQSQLLVLYAGTYPNPTPRTHAWKPRPFSAA